jgi:hypothetical protein
LNRCPVEGPTHLEQRRVRIFAVRATGLRAEVVERGQRTVRGDLEDRAAAVGPTNVRRPVENPTAANESRAGLRAVRTIIAVALQTKGVERGQRAIARDLENCATAGGDVVTVVIIDSAQKRGSVKGPIGVLDQRAVWRRAIRATALHAESVNGGRHAARGHFEDRACVGAPASDRCPVEVSVRGLDQGRRRIQALLAAEPVQYGEILCGSLTLSAFELLLRLDY